LINARGHRAWPVTPILLPDRMRWCAAETRGSPANEVLSAIPRCLGELLNQQIATGALMDSNGDALIAR
jgi:hypothetical protein